MSVAFDARVAGARPAPDPGVAYAAAIAAYVTAVDTGAEPNVPLMTDDGRSRPLMTRAEFIAAIEARPRVPAPGEDDDGSAPPTLLGERCRPADAPGEENDFSARA